MRKKTLKVGINGFGRIGRIATRIISERKNLQVVAVNSRADILSHRYLLSFDSVYGTFTKEVKVRKDSLFINNQEVKVFNNDDPGKIPWEKAGADIVIDATGKFRTALELTKHIKGNVKYVVLSAPAKDEIKTLVMGVNEQLFDPKKDKIISNSSCTTNCLSTVLKVLHESFRVQRGFMTTVHAVTDSQNLLDNSHKKEARLRRAAFSSMIPSSTGSAKDIGKLYPELKGKINCQAIRIPLHTVSLIILTVEVYDAVTKDKVNKKFLDASRGKLKGILQVADEELVSKDFTGNTHSSIVDPFLTEAVDGNLVTVYAWYDNEWGYTKRLIDMVTHIGKRAGII